MSRFQSAIKAHGDAHSNACGGDNFGCCLQVVYLAGDSSDEEQPADGSEDEEDMSEEEESGREGWDTDEEGDSEDNDLMQ